MSVDSEQTEKRDGSPERVKEVARQLHVHYQVYPEWAALRDHSIRQVGFDLQLHAGVGAESGVRLGDDRCKEAIVGLREISSFVVPADSDCSYDVDGSPAAFYYHGGSPEDRGCVRLDIRVFGREGWDRPVHGAVSRALHEMEERLQALGVPRASG